MKFFQLILFCASASKLLLLDRAVCKRLIPLNELIQSHGVRRLFVRLSVNFLRKSLLRHKWLDCDQTCIRLSPGERASRAKGHVIRAFLWCHENRFFSWAWLECDQIKSLHRTVSRWARIQGVLKVKVAGTWLSLWLNENRYFFHANGCILNKLESSRNLPFPLSVPFSSIHILVVKQFVKLFATQYGLTFCLYMRSLYEPSLHSPSRLSIRQLALMSKSWNQLLHHWRSCSYCLPIKTPISIYCGEIRKQVQENPSYSALVWHVSIIRKVV